MSPDEETFARADKPPPQPSSPFTLHLQPGPQQLKLFADQNEILERIAKALENISAQLPDLNRVEVKP